MESSKGNGQSTDRLLEDLQEIRFEDSKENRDGSSTLVLLAGSDLLTDRAVARKYQIRE